MKPRLRRLGDIYPKSPIFFITACIHKRMPLLAEVATHRIFQQFCARGEEQGFYVGRYVLMPDHLHLFLAVAAVSDRRAPVSDWVKAMKGVLSAHWKTEGKLSPFWQKGFFDHVLRTHESYSGKWEYVRMNPVRAGLVKSLEEWEFQGEIHALEVR